uniref:Uncharacterized protein n=1 Tax=viral metagenome TaxID=1070528 RepID=A0A6M3M313_9ZZZZ
MEGTVKAQASFGDVIILPKYKRERVMRILDHLEPVIWQMERDGVMAFFEEEKQEYDAVCERIRAKAAKLGVTQGFRWNTEP